MRFKQKTAIITVQRRHHPLVVIILEFVHLFLVAFILRKSNIKLGLSMCFCVFLLRSLSSYEYVTIIFINFRSNLSLLEFTWFCTTFRSTFSKLDILDDYEAMLEGQSSQPENSEDTFIHIRVEVKRLIFFLNIWISHSYEYIPTNKMCLKGFN